jgi:hypothetical protein
MPPRLRGLSLMALTLLLATAWLVSNLVVLPRAFAAGPLLGDATIESSTDTDSIGQAEAFAATASGSGAVSALSVYVDRSSTATRLVAGLYTDSGGHPGNLLAQGSLAAPTANAWNTVALATNVSVTTGATYWLTILGAAGSGNLAFRDRCCGSGSSTQTSVQTNLSALPATWSSGASWQDGPASIYAGTASAPTPTATAGASSTPSVTPSSTATRSPSPSPTAPSTPTPSPSATPTGQVIFSDTFSGTTLNPVWTVVTRHGEYAQNETECNVASAVSVNNGLTITTTAQSATCGDYNLNGSVRHTPSVWPYTTGDIQWNNFSFTYGTVTFRAKFPPESSGTWPSIWMLGSNCQATNSMTADTGYASCPALQTSRYTEIDVIECASLLGWCHIGLAQPNNWPECGFGLDSNWHTYTFVWARSSISLAIDGVPTCSLTAAQGYSIPSMPMFLLIQTQTGGDGGTPNNANLPATFQVSSVTVTQP